MLNRRIFIFGAASILAAILTATAIMTGTTTKSDTISVNSSVLSEQTKQNEQASVTDVKQDNSNASNINDINDPNVAETQNASNKDAEANIITYTVKSGDTLESIASTYNLKAKNIAESNNLKADSQLKEGQVLEFPSIDGVLYKIKNGETLWDLAMLNKIDFNKIVEVNKLESPDKLKLDQKIIMPGVDEVKSITPKTTNKITALNTSLNRGGSISANTTMKGSLPVRGKITSLFGERWGRQHEGIDIAAPVGTNVLASMDGTVSFSGWESGYGNLIIINHGNGLQSYYAHNSKLLVKKGQVVSKGTHIAEVGSTGNSTGPHCHFEIRKNGTAVNPFNYVK
ncbi:peptidoglycan DD-metalloendopeptidase family protein [Clostridium sp. SYSU_GA19001]|uniref:peptidoglycan DD-metalloendopeptidase family protein n=1 Tax=Clostridium caldaquaticum TaxID=2940653 RepID=UPI0020770933|nr:peptidoglycan DD-metalloendopeptidase family protein [Clostridium caldaquaticum]MCM8709993.1 peptidoglycan DD-metalloendopeptidase family protein [Clostridium caldaquaticum]